MKLKEYGLLFGKKVRSAVVAAGNFAFRIAEHPTRALKVATDLSFAAAITNPTAIAITKRSLL